MNGTVHNVLMQFFTLDSSKIVILQTYFFDTVATKITIQGKESNYLGCIYVFFTFFGYGVLGGGGGLLPNDW